MGVAKLSVQDISQHNKDTDCWIVVDNQVWDITSFAPSHPGGPGIIYKYAGRDATAAYNAIHSPSIIKNGLAATALKGTLDTTTITKSWSEPLPNETPSAAPRSSAEKPPLDSIINLHDFEVTARNTSTAKTWAFYSSAANDLITRDLNASIFTRLLFRPRVMRRVDKISTRTTFLTHPVSFPLMISPAAMAKLIHPEGELAISRACTTRNLIQGISNNASYSAREITQQPETCKTPHWFQLYVDRRKDKTEALLADLATMPNITAIMVTTDAASPGKREADERVKADESLLNPMQQTKVKNDKQGGGYGRLMAGFIDPDLNWEYIVWLRSLTSLPLMLKGVMSADDVKLALDHGLEGVMLSNHGGRNLDTSPPAMLVLLEIHARFPHVIRDHHPNSPSVRAGLTRPFSIFVDGGVRRGSDILKAVCLGAVGCGVGRPVLFATGYGQEGVEHCIDILRDEFETAMKNCGITSIEECGPEYVNSGAVDQLVCKTSGHLYAVGFNEMRSKARL